MRTLFDKLWEAHVVRAESPETPAVLYVDLHLVHEVTSPQAFDALRARGLRVRRPDRTLATMDHSTPTSGGFADAQALAQVRTLETNCAAHDVPLLDMASDRRGIVHVVAPELGRTRPGMTIVCGDSHTSTHGAFGALAFGIGTSEVAHVLATQCLLQRRPKTMRVRIDGRLGWGVTAKDLVLALIARMGVAGATGHVIEYAGEAVRALTMEERMTVCNMSIEAGARAGMVAPDGTTETYLAERGVRGDWSEWRTDEGATFDREVSIDASAVEPMITRGTTPATGAPVAASAGRAVQVVFIGSCTNGRLSDLREAARVMRGRRVADGVRVLVVPGSQTVKRQAEAEGLDRVFVEAGASWREPGCSMCIAMNGDRLSPGETSVSTSNRNFEGRQGPGGRTLLASPLVAAAAAVTGRVTDPRDLL